MATDSLMAPLNQIVLPPGAKIKLEAISPTTGLAITGVTVSNVAITGEDLSEDVGLSLSGGPFMFVPGPDA